MGTLLFQSLDRHQNKWQIKFCLLVLRSFFFSEVSNFLPTLPCLVMPLVMVGCTRNDFLCITFVCPFRHYQAYLRLTRLKMSEIILTPFNINSLRAPKKFLHALKRNVLTLYSNERVCQITQQNILCFLIHPFVVMETVDEVWKSNIWMRISVA